MDSYRYMFPFEQIPRHSRVLIYGAGMVGQEYLRQLLMTKYADVVGFLDRNAERRNQLIVPVWPLEKVQFLNFDFLVVALSHPSVLADIEQSLSRYGVSLDKIVYLGQRAPAPNIFQRMCAENRIKKTAFEYTKLSIALKLPSTLGDNIQRKGLFLSIVKVFPNC